MQNDNHIEAACFGCGSWTDRNDLKEVEGDTLLCRDCRADNALYGRKVHRTSMEILEDVLKHITI